MKRYEQSVRVITAFFSVLLGLGLKNFLDPKMFGPENARWPCFLMSVFLFLRFLLGSNNHMWFEFVRRDRREEGDAEVNGAKVSRQQILRDFFLLLIFGLVGVAICYSTTVDEFLKYNLWLTGIALAVGVFFGFIDCVKGTFPGKWGYWLLVNLTQFSSILVVHCLVIPKDWGTIPCWLSMVLPGPAWDWSLFILVVVYFGIFSWDFSKQLKILEDSHNPVTPGGGSLA